MHLPFFICQILIPKKEYTDLLGPVGFMYWWKVHYVKDVQIRSYFWSEYGKIRTRKNSTFKHFSHSGKRDNIIVWHTVIAWLTLMIYRFIWRKLIHPMQSSDFFFSRINPLSTNPTKWSNTLKQFVGKLPTNYLSVFDHFVKLAFKGLTSFLQHQIDYNINFRMSFFLNIVELYQPIVDIYNNKIQKNLIEKHLSWRSVLWDMEYLSILSSNVGK